MRLKCVLWRRPFIADFHLPREGLERNPREKRGITVYTKRSKDFPKPFLQSTEQGNDSYPKYRHLKPEDGGHTGEIKCASRENGWYR